MPTSRASRLPLLGAAVLCISTLTGCGKTTAEPTPGSYTPYLPPEVSTPALPSSPIPLPFEGQWAIGGALDKAETAIDDLPCQTHATDSLIVQTCLDLQYKQIYVTRTLLADVCIFISSNNQLPPTITRNFFSVAEREDPTSPYHAAVAQLNGRNDYKIITLGGAANSPCGGTELATLTAAQITALTQDPRLQPQHIAGRN